MDTGLRRRLEELCGPAHTGAAGVSAGSADEVAAVCRLAAGAGCRVRATSGALPEAAPAEGVVVVALGRLSTVAVHRPSLTARAGAGLSLEALGAALRGEGLAVAGRLGTPPPDPVHLGSLLARGGASRRALTGIEVVSGGGEILRCGGAMLKDVAPYDLAALLLGSAGRFGIITAATLRLQPATAPLADAAEPPGPLIPSATGELLRRALDPAGVLAGA